MEVSGQFQDPTNYEGVPKVMGTFILYEGIHTKTSDDNKI